MVVGPPTRSYQDNAGAADTECAMWTAFQSTAVAIATLHRRYSDNCSTTNSNDDDNDNKSVGRGDDKFLIGFVVT